MHIQIYKYIILNLLHFILELCFVIYSNPILVIIIINLPGFDFIINLQDFLIITILLLIISFYIPLIIITIIFIPIILITLVIHEHFVQAKPNLYLNINI